MGFFSSVSSNMHSEITRVIEASSACVAFERFVSSVNAIDVSLEIAGLSEARSAYFAFERLLSSVNAIDVSLEIAGLIEARSAYFAFERFISSMHYAVPSQMGKCFKSFLTEATSFRRLFCTATGTRRLIILSDIRISVTFTLHNRTNGFNNIGCTLRCG